MAYIGSSPANKPLTSSDIADSIVSLPKLSSGTDGNLITYDASGNPVAVATGSDGQVLTSTGAGSPPVFEASAVGGKVLQVIQGSNSTQTDTTSATATDIVTTAITPSSTSSKILFVAHANGLYSSTNGAFGRVEVVHSSGTTQVANSAPSGSNSTVSVGSASISYLDSPLSTSAITYKIQFKCPYTPGGVVRINDGTSMSTITLMEIAE